MVKPKPLGSLFGLEKRLRTLHLGRVALIVHEDEHLLVINKPAGWNTHAPSPYAGEGVYDWLKHREPRWESLAIIHRLDKETSGILVFGKTREANQSLTQQFSGREVKKRYFLLTDRVVRQEQFTSISTLVRAGERYVSRPLQTGAERAETRFRVVDCGRKMTLVEAEPVTGRTHQIRVHAAEAGFPILGDTLYGGTRGDRLYLHAAEIKLADPSSGQTLVFRAALPFGVSSAAHPRDPAPHERANIEFEYTNAYRLVHGAADGYPGWYVDKLGSWLLSQSEEPLGGGRLDFARELARDVKAAGAYHKVLSRHVRGAQPANASPQLVFGEPAPERFRIVENGLEFELSFSEGYSVGLFLDQRDNRRRLLIDHVAAGFGPLLEGQGEVLNTFAYTCGFSVAAAKTGVHTTSLDLSKKYLEWGRRNFSLNGIDPARHDFIYGDTFDWMRRLGKKNRSFNLVLLDPPTFSKSKESGTWQAERDYGKLVAAALPLLRRNGVLFCSTNAARLDPEHFLAMIKRAVAGAGRQVVKEHYVPQPPDFPISREEPAYLKTAWLRIK